VASAECCEIVENESALGFVVHFYGIAARTLDAHCGFTTMNVHWIESSTVASPIPILLMHSAGVRLRRKARRDTLWKLSIDEKAAHPVGNRFCSKFSLPHVKFLRSVRVNIDLFAAIGFQSSVYNSANNNIWRNFFLLLCKKFSAEGRIQVQRTKSVGNHLKKREV